MLPRKQDNMAKIMCFVVHFFCFFSSFQASILFLIPGSTTFINIHSPFSSFSISFSLEVPVPNADNRENPFGSSKSLLLGLNASFRESETSKNLSLLTSGKTSSFSSFSVTSASFFFFDDFLKKKYSAIYIYIYSVT